MTIYPQVRLEATGLPSFQVDHEHGVVGIGLDLGDAATRAVVEDAPDTDGTIDTTAFLGARTITLNVVLTDDGDIWTLKNRLRAFTHPRLRPWLYVTETSTSPEQRVKLRRSQFSDPIGGNPRGDISEETERAVSVQWIAPQGILETTAPSGLTISATGDSATSHGIVFPIVFPINFGSAPIAGRSLATNKGNADAYPVLRINGPVTGPIVSNLTVGASLSFPTLTILAGEYLEIDLRAKSALYQGDPTDSRLGWLDFTVSDWWALQPGDNTLSFIPTTSAPPASLEVTWHDAYL